MIYLGPAPVRALENWFYERLRAILPDEVFIVLGPKSLEPTALIPQSHVRIAYEAYYSNDSTTSITQGFVFTLTYNVSGASNGLNPHHPALDLMELCRKALWQQVPPVPANAFPLQLKSEKEVPGEKACGCKVAYQQTWRALNTIQLQTALDADPCRSAAEPGSVLGFAPEAIAPFNDKWYYVLNPKYDNTKAQSLGVNQPWLQDTVTSQWVVNPVYKPSEPVQWGNVPVILRPYFSALTLGASPQI
jgi:hypothetical protein